jgi:glycosyltransferase involved in cell wall biosynthesis
MRVLLLTRYARAGASSRIRCYQYLDYLRREGVDVTVAPFLDEDYLRGFAATGQRSLRDVARAYPRRLGWMLRARRYDLLWIQYELLPWLPNVLERHLTPGDTPYVVDYDDAQFHRYDRHPSRLIRRLLRTKLDRVMARAAVVVAGNEYLASRARAAGATDVKVVPSAVDLGHYPSTPEPHRSSVFTIGWIGSPTTARYLQTIAPALRMVCSRIPARILLIGSGPVDLGNAPREVRPWSEDTEAEALRTFDVGIMPLTSGPWELGKCGFKLVQYMAAATPAVASPVGANCTILQHGVTGYLANESAEWVERIESLASSAELRRGMGEAARRRAELYYSTDVIAPRLLDILHRARGAGRA